MPELFGADQLTNFSSQQRDTAKEATEEAKRAVAAGCRLVDGTDDENSLVEALRQSAIGKIQGGTDGYAVIVYDLKASGEDPKDPFQRSAPLRKSQVDSRTRVALKARSPDADPGPLINPGDLWIFFDDGRPGLSSQLQGSLKACPKTVKLLHIVYSEEGLLERRKSLSAVGQARRGFMNLRQVEGAHIVSTGDHVQLPQRDNIHYDGTSSGNALQAVGAPDILKDGWMMPVAEKKND